MSAETEKLFKSTLRDLRPLFKESGFHASSQNFILESSECWVIVNFQKSRWGKRDETTFYVNVDGTIHFADGVLWMYTSAMALIPLAVSDIWKVFEWANRRKTDNRAAVVEWLDAVYSDLEELSKVWIKIADSLETSNVDGDVKKAFKIMQRGSDAGWNGFYARRLLEFYQKASLVLNDRDDADFHDSFATKLGNVLNARRELRRTFDNGISPLAVGDSEHKRVLDEMKTQLTILQKDLVNLQVTIQTFKAQG